MTIKRKGNQTYYQTWQKDFQNGMLSLSNFQGDKKIQERKNLSGKCRFTWKTTRSPIIAFQSFSTQFLIESRQRLGIEMEHRAIYGWTILHFACKMRYSEVVDLVCKALEEANSDDIDLGIRIDALDQYRRVLTIPLHLALANKDCNVEIDLLKKYPHMINVTGHGNLHLLHCAALYGRIDVVKFVYENPKFDVKFGILDDNGNTPTVRASEASRSQSGTKS